MSRTPAWLAVLRGLILLGLGTAGMVWQMFFVAEPSLVWVGLSLAMILGEGAVSTWWLAGSRGTTAAPSSPPQPSVGAGSGGSDGG